MSNLFDFKKISKLLLCTFCLFLTTQSCKNDFGTFIDGRDGREYKWVRIGSDIWMAENLAYLPKVNTVAETSLNEEKYYVFGLEENDISKAKSYEVFSWNDSVIIPYQKYGVLYNWAAVRSRGNVENQMQDICPCGWHVPSDTEWMKLEHSLGMDSIELDAIGLRSGNFIGYKLKAKNGWSNNGNGIDTVGLSVLPGGEAFSGVGFLEEGEKATFWTTTEGLFNSTAWTRSILCCESGIVRIERDKLDGFSLRCVKD